MNTTALGRMQREILEEFDLFADVMGNVPSIPDDLMEFRQPVTQAAAYQEAEAVLALQMRAAGLGRPVSALMGDTTPVCAEPGIAEYFERAADGAGGGDSVNETLAKATCQTRCPVRLICLAAALDEEKQLHRDLKSREITDYVGGIFGGWDPASRKKIEAARRRMHRAYEGKKRKRRMSDEERTRIEKLA
ncbi:WhiB family transcriptional regulator [Leifsonia xyli]|uniref:WhiB family transcriptional regulator n=1 Tax=Leifsonia xyli TaxID=1575 RepID=UPI003D67D017